MHVFLHILLRFFLFFALVTTGAALDCEVCEGPGTTCSGKMVDCPSSKDTCVVVLVETIVAGEKNVSTRKGCESFEICSTPTFHMDMGNQTSYKASLVCCTGRNCNKASPRLPQTQTEHNGLECPACYSATGTCENDTVKCTGLDKFCFDVSTVLTADGNSLDYIIRGCTTQAVCASIITSRAPMMGEAIIKKATCTPNPTDRSARPGHLLPLIYGFLLLLMLL